MRRKPANTEWAANIDRLMNRMDGGKGWNQTQLAKAAGLNDNQVSKLIKKDGNPEIKQLRKVAQALGVELWELFVPADLASDISKGVELGTPLTPGDYAHAPEEEPSIQDQPPISDFTLEIFRAALTDPELRAAVSRAVSHFATARIADDRADTARALLQRAIKRSKTPPHG